MNTGDLVDALQTGIIALDDRGQVTVWNDWIATRAKVRQEDALGRALEDLFGALDPRIQRAVAEAQKAGRASLLSYALQPFPLPLHDPDSGEPIRQSIRVTPLARASGGRLALLQVIDVTDTVKRERLLRNQAAQLENELDALARAQAELARSDSRLRELARQAPVGIFEIDDQGRYVFVNDRWSTMTGLPAADAAGAGWIAGVHPDDAARVERRWIDARNARQRMAEEFRLRAPQGRVVWVRCETAPLFDANGRVNGHIGTASDITQSKQQTLLAEFRASHDLLTGLPNRSVLEHKLRGAIEEARSAGTRAALLFIDLDRFKQINDELGHDIGDRVLQVSAERLRGVVRSSDVVVRWGGDEFVVVLTNLPTRETIARVSADIERSIGEPVDLGGICAAVGSSIGVAVFPDDEATADALIRFADNRMYAIKRRHHA
ncbi:hypothetical protein GCM10025771_03270 [Niveibacterium umoris]|uniref:Diguanylate cyclase (GGDEF)-like protein/PAS domain S-box-containing protein n=1 Tax=Niveibacterium umoris TaxID=1193620 RepID=A0A840BMA9_9RHOO|nr:GGDEF domain-containing protein [Niveibacterium umoris]MBB4014130.1 diguanylate cyclase (GGDEF)-like protein/PAS domain S-box-containing protein [Niveibacterium umoris]